MNIYNTPQRGRGGLTETVKCGRMEARKSTSGCPRPAAAGNPGNRRGLNPKLTASGFSPRKIMCRTTRRGSR
jgi:hypothetical protein